MDFTGTLLRWYGMNKRSLPWRSTKDPYKIWLSEVILQQTRVEQGLPYYMKFTEAFPTVRHLANANEEKVMKLWQGLGYYSRARNLHHTAKVIVKDLNGKFPSAYEQIIRLKGIGQYTAGAIASFAFGEARTVVDGNVFRFFSRYFGIKTPIDSSKGKKQFFALAEKLLDKKDPGTFNQAIMEFGARQCMPKNPGCSRCPLHASCFAYERNCVSSLPVKKSKTRVRNRWFNYLVVNDGKNVLLNKRNGNDIWKGLYDFPLIESSKKLSPEKIFSSQAFKQIVKGKFTVQKVSNSYKHQLSHQTIHAQFVRISSRFKVQDSKFKVVRTSSIKKFALPRLIERYLQEEIPDYK